MTCALSIAMSVPVPMAMPTSARASAGASLMPSPAIATRRPCACRRAIDIRFVLRLHFGDDFVDRQSCSRRPAAVAALSPVSMTRRRPSALSAASAAGVVSLIGSPTAMAPGQLAVDAQEDHGAALRAQRVGSLAQRSTRSTPTSCISAALPSASAWPSDWPRTPCPVTDLNSSPSPGCDAARFGARRRRHEPADVRWCDRAPQPSCSTCCSE